MSITITKYVDVTSAVGAGNDVTNRSLTGRFYTENPLVPTDSLVSMTTLADVGSYFGTSSEEYSRAAFYFSYVSQTATTPQKIEFARWAAAATAPQIFGAKGPQSLTAWQAITAGAFGLTLGGVTIALTALNFSAAMSLAGVATIIQTAIISVGTGPMFDSATVSFDSTRSSFNLTGGTAGEANVLVTAGAGGADIAGVLGWLSPLAIKSNGSAAQSLTTLLDESTNTNNNFGSFAFLTTLTELQIVEVGTWNLAENNQYLYSVPVLAADAQTLHDAVINLGGTTVTLTSGDTSYPEQIPMMLEAATDYTKRNAVINYMYKQFNIAPTVFTNEASALYDSLRINYYGQTQTNGQVISFYQRGLMMGQATSPVDQNVYVNEIWLKDAATTAIMTLLLSLPQVPANNAGRSQLLGVLQSVINQALFNGVISVGKALNQVQKLYIAQLTGDSEAWQTVQNKGYWFDVNIVPYTEDGVTLYKAVYTLIYSKNDVIRFVEGHDILI